MRVEKSIEVTREILGAMRKRGKGIAFVPTMGYLHEGHLSLITIAKNFTPYVAVSVFVNPLQFNDPTDYEKYPVDLKRDLSYLEEAGVSLVFIPEASSIYGSQFNARVIVNKLTEKWEGVSRPGHFDGVATIVSMLFNIINPDIAVFGEKDFQQLRIIESMVSDLKFPIKIERGPIIRESDGLALSSRNVRLDKEARAIAPEIFRALTIGKALREAGEIKTKKIKEAGIRHLSGYGAIKVDYFSVVRESDLAEVEEVDDDCRILTAVTLNGVRLIDNLAI